MPNVM